MSTEHQDLVREFYSRVWAAGDVEFAREVFADDYVLHDLRPTTADPGWRAKPPSPRLFGPPFRTWFSTSIS